MKYLLRWVVSQPVLAPTSPTYIPRYLIDHADTSVASMDGRYMYAKHWMRVEKSQSGIYEFLPHVQMCSLSLDSYPSYLHRCIYPFILAYHGISRCLRRRNDPGHRYRRSACSKARLSNISLGRESDIGCKDHGTGSIESWFPPVSPFHLAPLHNHEHRWLHRGLTRKQEASIL